MPRNVELDHDETMTPHVRSITLVRHGRTAYNLARRLQGQIDIPLDIVGRWQADQSAYELAKTYYWAKVAHLAEHNDQLAQPAYGNAHLADVDEINNAPAAARRMLVVSSDLFRAQQTAHAFADLMGLDVELDPRLRERSFGDWEGIAVEELAKRFPEDYLSWAQFRGGELKYGAEPKQNVGRRGVEALNDWASKAGSDTDLYVFSHGSWIAQTVQTVLGLGAMHGDFADILSMRNAHWVRLAPLELQGALRWRLVDYNHGPAIADTEQWEHPQL